jgi:hypothetical protein
MGRKYSSRWDGDQLATQNDSEKQLASNQNHSLSSTKEIIDLTLSPKNASLIPSSTPQPPSYVNVCPIYKPRLFFPNLPSFNENGRVYNSVPPNLIPDKTTNILKPTKIRKFNIPKEKISIPQKSSNVPILQTSETLPPRKKRKIDENQNKKAKFPTMKNDENQKYDTESFRCAICKNNKFDCMLMPCHHVTTCYQCAKKPTLTKCPFLRCDKVITHVLKFNNPMF